MSTPDDAAQDRELAKRLRSAGCDDEEFTLRMTDDEAVDAIRAHTRAAVERETAQLRAEVERLKAPDNLVQGARSEYVLTERQTKRMERCWEEAKQIPSCMEGPTSAFRFGFRMAASYAPSSDAWNAMVQENNVLQAKLTAAEGTVAQLRTRLDVAREALEAAMSAVEDTSESERKFWGEKDKHGLASHAELVLSKVTNAISSLREGEK